VRNPVAILWIFSCVMLAALPGHAAPTEAGGPGPGAFPCPIPSAPVALGAAQWNGWGRDLNNSRYQPEPAIPAADVPRLALKWAFGFVGGPVFGQSTIVDGRLFVTGAAGRIQALDAKRGCSYWSVDTNSSVATALIVGELSAPRKFFALPKLKRKNAHIEIDKPPSAVLFGDSAGFVSALDAQHGTLLWKVLADTVGSGRISGSPTLYKNRLFVPVNTEEHGTAPAAASVVALDVATGSVVWRVALPRSDAGLSIVSAPTLDVGRELLYVATAPAPHRDAPPASEEPTGVDGIVALDLKDGHVHWSRALDPGSPTGGLAGGPAGGGQGPPILRNALGGRQVILAGPDSGVVFGLDPNADGAILWQSRLALDHAAALPQYGSAADYRSVYVGSSDGLSALNIGTGETRWSAPAPTPACSWGERDCAHGQSQALTVMPGIVFAGALDGHLRAYSTIDGRVVWDFDTARSYRCVNGISVSGGPLDHAGASIVNGMLYIKSGDALLAFSVDGK
jgi:polyvinyl alcohol dehydrogenase (cytochrome)